MTDWLTDIETNDCCLHRQMPPRDRWTDKVLYPWLSKEQLEQMADWLTETKMNDCCLCRQMPPRDRWTGKVLYPLAVQGAVGTDDRLADREGEK